jgi:hypothetical protein
MGNAETLINRMPRSHLGTVAALLAAGLAVGLLIGLFAPVLRILMFDPNVKPVAVLVNEELRAQVGERIFLNGALSAVPGHPESRLRFEWFDTDGDFRLLPAGIDPEGPAARLLEIYGAGPGERRITLRVTNTSRCYMFGRVGLSPRLCEKSGEQIAHITFAGEPERPPPAPQPRIQPEQPSPQPPAPQTPPPCRPGGGGLPVDRLVLDGPRVINADNRNADCRLVLPALIVTNGFPLRIEYQGAVEAGPGGTRIVAFQNEAAYDPRTMQGPAGSHGSDGEGTPGTHGGPGMQGRPGANAGAIVIEASRLSGSLAIDDSGQTGGRGGTGGRAGNGGRGVSGASAIGRGAVCERPAGNGMRGGDGGRGGPGGGGGAGGNGGEVRITLAQPVAAPDRLTVRSDGGQGGVGGGGGAFGFQGDGGHAGTSEAPCPAAQPGEKGQPGSLGPAGQAGSRGAPGASELKAGNVPVRAAGPMRQGEQVQVP